MEEQRLDGSSEFDYFGTTVFMSSDGLGLAVGAPYGDDGNDYRTGNMYIYSRESKLEDFNEKQRLDGASWRSRFGRFGDMSSDGLNLVVGAPKDYYDEGSGSVYIYSRDIVSSLFEEKQRLDGASSNEAFGYNMAITDNGLILAIGAPSSSYFGGSSSGSVYIFARKSRLDDFVEMDRFDGGCYEENLGDDGIAIDVTEKGLIIRAKGYSCDDGKYVRSYEVSYVCYVILYHSPPLLWDSSNLLDMFNQVVEVTHTTQSICLIEKTQSTPLTLTIFICHSF